MSKTALITGASVGIGYELSKIFAKNGYNLVLVSRNKQKLEAADDVAKIGYSGLMKGKKIIIPGLMNKLLAFSVRLTPRPVLVLILRFLNQKK